MYPKLRIYAAAASIAALHAFPLLAASAVMPVEQQNSMVQRYCAVCHTDAHKNGGLSLQHFDAANPDPGDVAMILSKMKDGAFGAAGLPTDKAKEDALVSALLPKAAGAERWSIQRGADPATKAPILTASIVREVPAGAKPNLYRLTLTCNVDAGGGEVQLAWAPGVPDKGRVMSATVDGKAPVTYKIEGSEKMGNGTDGVSGPGSILLKMPVPDKTLTIRDVFGEETVVFPFDALTQTDRRDLAKCLTPQ